MKNIYSWNVNGVRACSKKGFLTWLLETNPDIVAIQEIKANRNQLDDEITQVKNYSSYWYSADRKGYSGVALYTKEKPILMEKLGIEKFDIEGRTLIAHYPKFSLINCYFPNSQEKGARLDYKLEFCNAILKKCNNLVKEGKNIVICGDYNIAHTKIDLKNPKSNEKNPGYLPQERDWMSKFLKNGYIDTFRQFHPNEPGHYSWWSYRYKAREKDIGWRIDYFCVNKNLSNEIIDTKIHKTIMGSDHCPVSITLKD